MVSHDVGMPASFQHENLLLEGGDIVVWGEKVAMSSVAHGRDPCPKKLRVGVRKELLGAFSPGSIFTIFKATRSLDTLSRAL